MENIANELDDSFLKKGIMLIADGTDPELVERIMSTCIVASNKTGVELLKLVITLSGILSIQADVHPRFIEERLKAYIGEDAIDYRNENKNDETSLQVRHIEALGKIKALEAQVEILNKQVMEHGHEVSENVRKLKEYDDIAMEILRKKERLGTPSERAEKFNDLLAEFANVIQQFRSVDEINFNNVSDDTLGNLLICLPTSVGVKLIERLPADRQVSLFMTAGRLDTFYIDTIYQARDYLNENVAQDAVLAQMTNDDIAKKLASLLSHLDRSTEKHIIEILETDDIELAEVIRRKMFGFDDLILLQNRDIQRVLREIDHFDLVVALKGASAEVKSHIFANLTKRNAATTQDDLNYLGPIRRVDCDEAQQKIINIVRRLTDVGEIIIPRAGRDSDVMF